MSALADALFEQRLFKPACESHQGESISLNQQLAHRIANQCFDLQRAQSHEKLVAPYKKDNSLLPGMDKIDIIDSEKKRWASIFECTKWAGGVYSAYKWAPQLMPKEVPPAALLEWKKKTGQEFIVYGSKSHSELLKELKLKYISTCVGSMALGWTASHVVDSLLFSKDQYLEGTVAGDLAGIGLAIAVPGWRSKALCVAGSHLLGKTVDHWRQPVYPTRF